MASRQLRFSLIGGGRLGHSLARALYSSSFELVDICSRNMRSARSAARFAGAGRPISKLSELSDRFDVLWLTVPDDQIELVTGQLCGLSLVWTGKHVWHASGALTSELLESLARRGAKTASVHPLQTIPRPSGPEIFRGIFFAIEGQDSLARRVVSRLGGNSARLRADIKPLYHALATLACGLSAGLYLEAFEAYRSQVGDPRALHPLVHTTVLNLLERPDASSLSGPQVRGDQQTTDRHLRALAAFPELRQAYLALGRIARKATKR